MVVLFVLITIELLCPFYEGGSMSLIPLAGHKILFSVKDKQIFPETRISADSNL